MRKLYSDFGIVPSQSLKDQVFFLPLVELEFADETFAFIFPPDYTTTMSQT